MKISSISFKGYIPVEYYAIEGNGKKPVRIASEKNVRKCQNKIVRNLNRSIQNPNEKFNEYYANFDKDYAKYPFVRSYYSYRAGGYENYIVSGYDAEKLEQLAKPIGYAKSEAIERTGNSRSYEARNASKKYHFDAKSFLKNSCKRVKTQEGKNCTLQVVFEPVYTKKEGKLKDFKLKGVHMKECEN